jgi:hypothetical protein
VVGDRAAKYARATRLLRNEFMAQLRLTASLENESSPAEVRRASAPPTMEYLLPSFYVAPDVEPEVKPE